MKQLESDPWDGIEAKYPAGKRITGRVTNITDYGAFVELEPGIEGLIHVSEMSWTKKNVHPGKIVSTSPGSRSGRSRSRPGQAPHFARPQADPREPVGFVR
jgi:polyribonucleotide nucleotidyltransferase